tara:strand:+ start:185 stop:3154 length:2970 start_codon:yes stop_codon:yes gene_type:complete
MGLKIRHNRAEHAHENVQFRRIATGLSQFFEQKGWDGLLIGNPESEDFSRFRADALLLYNHGLIIIDLKDYQGSINLPPNDNEFNMNAWYIDTEGDKSRIEIKGGSRFANPFRQLKSYRQVMYEVIEKNIILHSNLDPSRTCAVNLFSGPIELNRKIPGNLPYYKITQESSFYNFLYDYNSINSYSKESADALNAIFPAEIWEEQNAISVDIQSKPERVFEIESDLESEIKSFLYTETSGILVLESMEASKRDAWVHYILSEVVNHNIPQAETWVHSSRIRRKIKMRSGIAPDSLYNTIYGGSTKSVEITNAESSTEDDSRQVEGLIEVVPIRSDESIDERAVIIIQDAHLVSRSLHQSDLLRFGSGRLLEDLIKFLALDNSSRKLICIGDPYSLSYGKEEESAIALETLKELFDGQIQYFRAEPQIKTDSSIHKLRFDLGASINNKVFNYLEYPWGNNELISVEKTDVLYLLKQWFSKPLTTEPRNTVLFYSNNDANKANLWIKKNCLNSSNEIASEDLLLLNNNVSVPDETGFGNPTTLYNGMYVIVKEKLQEHPEIITIDKETNQQVTLNFIKLRVQCLSLDNKQETEIWLNDNYFSSNGKLSKEEQIAFRVFINKKIVEYKKEHTFESSKEYRLFQQDNQYALIRKLISDLNVKLKSGEKVVTQIKNAEADLKRLERKYKKKYNSQAMRATTSSHPLLNTINATYGWCITVHKSVGSNFENIIFNVTQMENTGVNNARYFRWLYSGITTSNSKVYVSNPIELSPFMDCQFEDMIDDSWAENGAGQKNSFEFDDFEIPKRFTDIILSELNQNAQAAISLFSESIENEGIILERTQKLGDYISKAFYSTPNNGSDLTMVFNNNGKGLVTSMRAERNGEPFIDLINNAIQNICEASKKDKKTDVVAMPNDFRKDIYQGLINRSSELGGELTLTACNAYHDIFIYKNDNDKIEFKLIYNGKGVFSYLKTIRKTNSNISIALHDLIFFDD